MIQYKVTNRTSRKTQIMNVDEYIRFFQYKGDGKFMNDFRDYAVSTTLSEKDKQYNKMLDNILLGLLGALIVIVSSDIIFNLIK